MSDQDALVEQFIGVTGVTRDRAQFFLESSGWDLNVAMASFYDEDGGDDIAAEGPPMSVEGSRFGSIGIKPPSDSESDEGEEFFAGGSETSGQAILGPKKKGNIVENLFKSAKDHGAEVVDRAEMEGGRKPKSKTAFIGSGYRLGETEDVPSEVVAGGSRPRQRPSETVVLKLWKDGFSLGNGELRSYDDPQNKEFLASISKGEIPRELIRAAKGGEVNLNMEDKRNEDYVKPKVSMRAFSGEGHTLGSPVPNVACSENAPKAAETTNSAQVQVKVDESQPCTSLQIRLADGSRLVAKFNHHNTVQDVRRYITTARPEYASASFVLQTTFPNKELTEETQSLDEAKLLNAVIVQRLK